MSVRGWVEVRVGVEVRVRERAPMICRRVGREASSFPRRRSPADRPSVVGTILLGLTTTAIGVISTSQSLRAVSSPRRRPGPKLTSTLQRAQSASSSTMVAASGDAAVTPRCRSRESGNLASLALGSGSSLRCGCAFSPHPLHGRGAGHCLAKESNQRKSRPRSRPLRGCPALLGQAGGRPNSHAAPRASDSGRPTSPARRALLGGFEGRAGEGSPLTLALSPSAERDVEARRTLGRRPGAGRGPISRGSTWVPACAGTTQAVHHSACLHRSPMPGTPDDR